MTEDEIQARVRNVICYHDFLSLCRPITHFYHHSLYELISFRVRLRLHLRPASRV